MGAGPWPAGWAGVRGGGKQLAVHGLFASAAHTSPLARSACPTRASSCLQSPRKGWDHQTRVLSDITHTLAIEGQSPGEERVGRRPSAGGVGWRARRRQAAGGSRAVCICRSRRPTRAKRVPNPRVFISLGFAKRLGPNASSIRHNSYPAIEGQSPGEERVGRRPSAGGAGVRGGGKQLAVHGLFASVAHAGPLARSACPTRSSSCLLIS